MERHATQSDKMKQSGKERGVQKKERQIQNWRESERRNIQFINFIKQLKF